MQGLDASEQEFCPDPLGFPHLLTVWAGSFLALWFWETNVTLPKRPEEMEGRTRDAGLRDQGFEKLEAKLS